MKKSFLVGMLILFSCKVWAIFDPPPDVTPAGTAIEKGSFLVDNKWVDIEYFYIYQRHLIGKSLDNQYFIYDEDRGEIKFFKDKINWENTIKKQNLQPYLWTRWHQGEWNYLNDLFFVVGFLTMLSSGGVPLLIILFFYLLYRAARFIFESEEISLNFLHKTIIGVAIVAICNILLQSYPQSI
ncbi:MAG: hypothetical protein MUE85_07785 [Microscillaceae bacterium]|jgi:hypothetical protein|nr:hypothetical protein [Microscillaceae bacterium]